MRAEYIIEKAKELISVCGDRDPYDAAKQTGAMLRHKDLGSLKGAYFGNMEIPVIVINSTLDEIMDKIVCAHELGHHILHKGQMLSCENAGFEDVAILEREANIFASAFLIDTDRAINLLNEGMTISQVAATLETSTDLLMFLLNTLKLTDAPQSTFLQ